jgi:F0F1-type ATP synthase assembly protein I
LDDILSTRPLMTLVFLILAFIEVMRILLKGGQS